MTNGGLNRPGEEKAHLQSVWVTLPAKIWAVCFTTLKWSMCLNTSMQLVSISSHNTGKKNQDFIKLLCFYIDIFLFNYLTTKSYSNWIWNNKTSLYLGYYTSTLHFSTQAYMKLPENHLMFLSVFPTIQLRPQFSHHFRLLTEKHVLITDPHTPWARWAHTPVNMRSLHQREPTEKQSQVYQC